MQADQANGVTLHSEAFGNSWDPVILLVMGAMASAVWWPDEFCKELAGRGRYVVRYDHRDTGKSTSYEAGAAPYKVEDLADDAVGVLDSYEIDAAHLVGMSLGGYLSQLVALKHPRRVLSLTLIASERLACADPTLPPMSPSILKYHARAGELDWTDQRAIIDYQVGARRLLSGSAHPFDEAAIRAMAQADLDRSPNPLAALNHATLADADAWVGRLDEVRAPALIIHGSEDPALPYAHALALEAALPRSTLLTLERTGHELHRNDWPVILDAIARHTADWNSGGDVQRVTAG
jgi:pimeloyl-ACP methyl ester carboxylesterase